MTARARTQSESSLPEGTPERPRAFSCGASPLWVKSPDPTRGDCQGVHDNFLSEDHTQYKAESHDQARGPHMNNRGPFLSKQVLQMRGCNRRRGPNKVCRGSLLCLIFILSFG